MACRYFRRDTTHLPFALFAVWLHCVCIGTVNPLHGFNGHVCKLLIKPNHILYLRRGGGGQDWHLSLPPWSLCFKMPPLPFISNPHCLMEIIDFCLFSTNEKRLWLNILSPNLNSKIPINTRGNSLKRKEKKKKKEVAKTRRRGGREWNNEWSPSELSLPGRAPLGMQTLSHQKWATYLWKEWLLHPIWFGSPIIS